MFRCVILAGWILVGLGCPLGAADRATVERPNILWISTEDISPDLGCYGDRYAISPHIDRLAAEGVRFTRCFSHAGVCAPARSGLITGMYPPSIGTQHMRCKGIPPAFVRCFPEYLRAAGYYCTNNSKTDYQFDAPATVWDASSNKADWSGRAEGQPFFAVINFTTTHESQIRDPSAQTQKLVAALDPSLRHDPAKANVPPYYSDTPLVRRDLANYADNITAMDGQVGAILERLERERLAEDTIVWFWGDHGRGLPRCKRWLYDSGTQVPLIVRVPEKWRKWASPDDPEAVAPGSLHDELVAFVDFAPTMLSLAGLPIPEHLQGQVFLGPRKAAPREYVYGHRDRMDEAYDIIRSVRDRRFHYLRNFMPWVTYAQRINYMDQMPTMQELRRLNAAGQLSPEAALFFREEKPLEELYDTEADPHELNNLAGDPAYAEMLNKMRGELDRWMAEIGDLALVPEPTLDELKRPGGKWSKTASPGVQRVGREGGRSTLNLVPGTAGSSIGWRVAGSNGPLQVVDGPLTLADGQMLEFQAFRIGYRDSAMVRYTVGAESIAAGADDGPEHWRDVLDRQGTLPQLKEVFSGTSQPVGFNSNSPTAVRYWQLANQVDGRTGRANSAEWPHELETMLQSAKAPELRVVIAKGLVKAGKADVGLPVLAEALAHPHDSVGLTAAIALEQLGEAARPVLPAIEAATKRGEYTGRVSERIVAALGGEN